MTLGLQLSNIASIFLIISLSSCGLPLGYFERKSCYFMTSMCMREGSGILNGIQVFVSLVYFRCELRVYSSITDH